MMSQRFLSVEQATPELTPVKLASRKSLWSLTSGEGGMDTGFKDAAQSPPGSRRASFEDSPPPLLIQAQLLKRIVAHLMSLKLDSIRLTEIYPEKERDKVQIGRAVQQECRDRSRMPSSA
eukprot:TRINITY_DN23013_c0_g1_i1.p1 TRINITY_DN23013_c0_g1~~TRINITY_DN23013_c0_g1_i1.p1  ORF type:complete len:120 (+),score=32.05 TRINITY_DN23013_c0_g1_i1:176-535(+)